MHMENAAEEDKEIQADDEYFIAIVKHTSI